MADAVGPLWRARVANLYAGRTRHAGVPTAMSDKNPKGGMVALGFDFTYSLMGSVITWSDFLQDTDKLREHPELGENMPALRDGALSAFALLRERGADGIRASRIFDISDASIAERAAQIQSRAEVWVIGHEVGHHILRHGTSRPDRDAARRVREYMSDAGVLVETAHLSSEQRDEIDADVLAYLLTCGEFADTRHPRLEMLCASAALLALVAVGLLNDDWTSAPGQTHPGTVTRLAVIARIAAQRILEDDTCTKDEREELVRTLSSILAYAAWMSGVAIAPGNREDHVGNVISDFMHASTRLMVAWQSPIYQDRAGD
jgi:hypothetical protein